MIYGLLKKSVQKTSYKIISFDIFDTLIEREQLSPIDIFTEVGKQVLGDPLALCFCYDRIEAERKAREKKSSRETNIDEIYEHLKTKYGDVCDRLQAAEINCEIDSCKRKKEIYEVYKEAQKIDKRIIIVSDMYLGRGTLQKMLHRCGYEDYGALYISNEENASKRSGKLFDIVLSKEKVKAYEILHIGDSLKADFIAPRHCRMSSLLIPRKNIIRRKLHEKSIRGKC